MGIPHSRRRWPFSHIEELQLLAFIVLVGSHDIFRYHQRKVKNQYQILKMYLKTTCTRLLTPASIINSRHGHGQQFTHFPNLPPEIRYQIWRATFPPPRTVEIRYDPEEGVRSICRLPITLHICKESRKVAKETYSLAFGMQILPMRSISRLSCGLQSSSPKIGEVGKEWRTLKRLPARVYVDFERDTVFFGRKCMFYSAPSGVRGMDMEMDLQRLNNLFADDLRKIRKLAVRSDFLFQRENWGLDGFDNLEELVVVYQWHSGVRFDLGCEPLLRVSESIRSLGDMLQETLEEREKGIVLKEGRFEMQMSDKWNPQPKWLGDADSTEA